uniref:Olfactory receptor 2D2-like n=1 Tax=Petromyzon marinus TaxID=7757 RepID=A0AAJ7XE71_PETMA|nr:olfactory receptor 2D2-like [Petromyzon marinus]
MNDTLYTNVPINMLLFGTLLSRKFTNDSEAPFSGDNGNITNGFFLNSFGMAGNLNWIIFTGCLVMQLFIIVANCLMMATVLISSELHGSMYVLLCSLAVADITGSVTIIPKQLQMLASGSNEISYVACMAQVFFINMYMCNETLSLSFMSIDRYLAICEPLRYHAIFPVKRSLQILALAWFSTAVVNATLSVLIARLQINEDNRFIESPFCYNMAVILIASSDTGASHKYLSAILLTFVGLPPLTLMYSFTKVCFEFRKPTSPKLSKKARDTLVTQLIVTLVYFISIVTAILRLRIAKFNNSNVHFRNINHTLKFSIFLQPVANIVTYCLRVTALRRAMVRSCQKCAIGIRCLLQPQRVWAAV